MMVSSYGKAQIEQAACGCVSGTLEEWPSLYAALRDEGMDLPSDTAAPTLK